MFNLKSLKFALVLALFGMVVTVAQASSVERPPDGGIYGPGYTARWYDLGAFRIQKIIENKIRLDLHDQYINELSLFAEGNDIDINSVVAVLSNGQAFEMRHLAGGLRRDQGYRNLLDYRNSLRLREIQITAKAGLIGGRPNLRVHVGTPY